jgi:regulator of protease activity HflC (stomatin/prohibitin superfamily)
MKNEDENKHEDTSEGEGIVESIFRFLLTLFGVILFIPLFPIYIRTFNEYERGVAFRLGVVQKPAKGPGLVFFLPLVDTWATVDLRLVSADVPRQDVISSDNVPLLVNALVYYRPFDAVKAVLTVDNWRYATSLVAQTTLRSVIGSCSLQELLQNREEVNNKLLGILDKVTDAWGVRVEKVEIKDIQLPQGLQRAMSAEAESEREARAKIVAADGELQSSLKLVEAAKEMSKSPATLSLRFLQTLTTIASEQDSVVVALPAGGLFRGPSPL